MNTGTLVALEKRRGLKAVPGSTPGPSASVDSGDVAQLGEHLLCKQVVVGSIPTVSTRYSLIV